MMITFHRSSSLGALEFCEMKYFFQYVLGKKDKTNKRAVLGTIFHRAMQVLADKKIAQRDKKKKLENDDICDMTFAECDDIDHITEVCFNYYKEHEKDVDLTPSDLKTCIKWVYKAIAYNDGALDPRNQDVYATELFFDFQIKKPWAKYHYEIQGKVFEGYLGIKGTVDLIVFETEDYFQILDYKTGKRLNWATDKPKEYEDLQNDKQLLLYYYALKNEFPDKEFYVSIYYVNDGGVFDFAFGDEEYEKAEKMLRSRFEYIRSVGTPKQLSPQQKHWKCQKLCKFSEFDKKAGKSTCNVFHDMIKSKGIHYVTEKYADVNKFGTYGDGGGRIAEQDTGTD